MTKGKLQVLSNLSPKQGALQSLVMQMILVRVEQKVYFLTP